MLKYKEARKIIHDYIKEQSILEINIGCGLREDVLLNFKICSEISCSDEIFDDAYVEVKMMLMECWKKFIKTKEFLNMNK